MPSKSTSLVLESLPNGEPVWLRPEAIEGPRYVVTDSGRRALAMEALFGQPWPPTLADVADEAF